MRFAVAVCFTLATAVIEARPSTVPDSSSQLDVEQSMGNAVKARGLGDVLHNALGKHSGGSNSTSTVSASSSITSSKTSTSTPVTTSSSSVSATSSTSSPDSISSSSRTSATPTQTSSPSSSSIPSTLSSSTSTENPSPSHLGLGSLLGGGPKDKASEDTQAETYGNDKISTSRSLGTTGDRIGFRWAPVNSSD